MITIYYLLLFLLVFARIGVIATYSNFLKLLKEPKSEILDLKSSFISIYWGIITFTSGGLILIGLLSKDYIFFSFILGYKILLLILKILIGKRKYDYTGWFDIILTTIFFLFLAINHFHWNLEITYS